MARILVALVLLFTAYAGYVGLSGAGETKQVIVVGGINEISLPLGISHTRTSPATQ